MPVDYRALNALSNRLVEFMGDNQVPVGEGILALALTLGRMLGSNTSPEEEMQFVQDILDWAGTYWAEGQAN